MEYSVINGTYTLNSDLAILERNLFREFEDMLDFKGFQYLSIPSLISWDTFDRQQIDVSSLSVDKIHRLGGSAEQGILQYFSNRHIEPTQLYSKNQCFRHENNNYDGLKYCKEFIKLEQFCFCNENEWKNNFELLLNNATEFLDKHSIKYRVVDMTNKDQGYHIKKYDIEVLTKMYGWLETHSCSYFGEEQTKRFNISGATHSISNTGIASPRILIPFIERS
jgi:Seryl-tRNA synthetase